MPVLRLTSTRKILRGKAVCKRALQTALGLPRGETPLFGMVSRLVWDKGIDLLLEALDGAPAQEMQVVVLGTGAPELEMALLDRVRANRTRVRVILDYDDALARRIYAGSDFYVMPSRREPCGLSQMYGLAYGAIPIVRSTGGLADTREESHARDVGGGKGHGAGVSPSKRGGVGEGHGACAGSACATGRSASGACGRDDDGPLVGAVRRGLC